MDQNASTPRGGPQPKRANIARPVFNDSNIEQTFLMDTTNFAQQFQQQVGQKADVSVANNEDSLDECSFMNDICSAQTTLELPEHQKLNNLSLVREDEELSSCTLTPNSSLNQKENGMDIKQLLERCEKKNQELQNLSASVLLSPVKEVEMEVDEKENSIKDNPITSPVKQDVQEVRQTPIKPTELTQISYSNEVTREVTQSFCLSPQQQEQKVELTPASFRVQADVHEPKVKDVFQSAMSPAPADQSKHPNTPLNGDLTMEHSVQPELIKSTLEEVRNATMKENDSIQIQANDIQDVSKQVTLEDASFVLSPMAPPHLNASNPNQKSPFSKVKRAIGQLIRSPSSTKSSRKRSITLNSSQGRGKFEEVEDKSFNTFNTSKQAENIPLEILKKDEEFVGDVFNPETQCEDVEIKTPHKYTLKVENESVQLVNSPMCVDVANVSAIEATPARSVNVVTPARTVNMNATLSEFVEVSSLVRDIVEAEVPIDSVHIDEFSDKLSNLDFMMAEYAVAILNRQPSKVLMSEITDHLGDCVRSLIQLVSNSNRNANQMLLEKERSDFEHVLNIERQKAKNGLQERQMLCARIEELELAETATKLKSSELEEELKRCMDSLDDADSLEKELLRYKAKCAELEKKLDQKK